MKILVLGSGAREHAIIKRLLTDREQHTIVAAPGNAGISSDVDTVALNDADPTQVAQYVAQHPQDLVIVGPEAPLVAGVADAVRALGIPVFGPNQDAAALEGSKTFAKAVMEAANVPTGGAIRATTLDEVRKAMSTFGPPYVIKADGLAAGKGVIVTEDEGAALDHAAQWIEPGPLLIEEFLAGQEVSLFFLSDGVAVVPLEPGQDFKRLLDNDHGPNTGGMGAYSPLPWLPEGFISEVQDTIAQPVITQLAVQGTPFVGLLYCGLILTENGIKVIEFNARFGDPETQVILPRLLGEFGSLLHAAAIGNLGSAPKPTFSDEAAVTVVLASEGYPERAITGRTITLMPKEDLTPGVDLIHAATRIDEQSRLVATGGRVLNVVCTAATLAEARQGAYHAIGEISLEGGQYRNDIAQKVV